jgi:toxin ParE1/3/4
MANYRLSPEAEGDIIRIHQYGFRQFGLPQADKYIASLYQRFEEIAANPLMYPEDAEHEGYRRSVYDQDVIYYRVADDHVVMIAILGRQDHKNWL